MNHLQRIVFLIGLCIIGLMLLVPPWRYVELREGDNIERNAGYGFIFSPPSVKDHEAIREAFSIPKNRTIDISLNMNRTTSNVSISNMSAPTPKPTPKPTPEIVPVEIIESDYEVRLDSTRLLIQCGVIVFVALGFAAFLYKPHE